MRKIRIPWIVSVAIIALMASLLLWMNAKMVPSRFVRFPQLSKALLYKNQNEPWHVPLNEVEWLSPDQASHMKKDDYVLGVNLNNTAWALPWWVMKNHHVANLLFDHSAVLISFCEVCSSASAYSPVINGSRYTFHPVGHYNGSNLISDLQTNSLWAPFNGEAVYGPMKGAHLERFPLYQCTWKEWLSIYPDTQVAYGTEEMRKGHSENSYPGGPGLGKSFTFTLLRPLDTRLPANELVLGVSANGKSRAYSVTALDKIGSVLNDRLGGMDIVILHKRGSILACAFARQVDGNVLSFKSDQDGRIMDQKYGSLWTHSGEAIQGVAAGRRLVYVFSGIEEWYIWAAYHPDTDIFL